MTAFVLPVSVYAVSQSSILVSVAPENPAPDEDVTITINSYASNLDTVFISWSVDGKSVLSGVGKKSFSLKAPSAGSETSVVAAVYLPDGEIDKRIIIKPFVMILLWQTDDSYTPPFYRGKALPTPESQIKIVAMPEIRNGTSLIKPKNMTYSWKKDYTNNVDGSGYGKDSFVFVNDYLESSTTIDVAASTIDQKSSSSASIAVETTDPKIMFYKKDPKLGTVWEHALFDGHKVVGDETIEASPYFISPKDLRIPILTWNWAVNDSAVETIGINKNLIPLKVQPGVSGTAKINLEISSKYKIFATTNKELNVEF